MDTRKMAGLSSFVKADGLKIRCSVSQPPQQKASRFFKLHKSNCQLTIYNGIGIYKPFLGYLVRGKLLRYHHHQPHNPHLPQRETPWTSNTSRPDGERHDPHHIGARKFLHFE